ncbi:YraN family protein [Candidatus Uhrbacteria bacterium]|nr:YraN family protein [Candidatus Uhrbacteria bacterium]
MDARRKFGNFGEKLAANFLVSQGFILREVQYRQSFGEIDLICQDGDEVVFVEVKTRNSQASGYPEESVTEKKIQHLIRVAEHYLLSHRLTESAWRIDVVAIECHAKPPLITHFKNIDIPEILW